ncbi:MAG: hypothetical protein LBQ79_14510 [Deltaproteobacteria bacterium]|nr:hypothetical protein [Deltaproteobacteria bacterium]
MSDPASVATAPGTVTHEPAVAAASAQDAANARVAQRSAGFSELNFPSGYGFSATGVASYTRHESVVATRIDQRNAYNRAYMGAKRYLSEGLFGLSNEGKTAVAESMVNLDDASGPTRTRAETLTEESITQSVEALLRGYVVYDVHDDFDTSTVYVTIVTTPKTQGHFERPEPDAIAAGSVAEGLGQALAEIRKGLVPPVGGRTVFVPATGELAFVGFGSAVVRVDSDAALQAKHNVNAERIARMRAADALFGIITGDRVTAVDKLDSQSRELLADFEAASKDDPLAAAGAGSGSPGYRALAERKREFTSVESSSSAITSLRSGVLPPGVKSQGWRDPENAFAYSVAVYLPSATARAGQAAESMRSGTIVRPPSGSVRGGGGPAGSASAQGSPDAGPLTQGPSGRVQGDDDL